MRTIKTKMKYNKYLCKQFSTTRKHSLPISSAQHRALNTYNFDMMNCQEKMDSLLKEIINRNQKIDILRFNHKKSNPMASFLHRKEITRLFEEVNELERRFKDAQDSKNLLQQLYEIDIRN